MQATKNNKKRKILEVSERKQWENHEVSPGEREKSLQWEWFLEKIAGSEREGGVMDDERRNTTDWWSRNYQKVPLQSQNQPATVSSSLGWRTVVLRCRLRKLINGGQTCRNCVSTELGTSWTARRMRSWSFPTRSWPVTSGEWPRDSNKRSIHSFDARAQRYCNCWCTLRVHSGRCRTENSCCVCQKYFRTLSDMAPSDSVWEVNEFFVSTLLHAQFH